MTHNPDHPNLIRTALKIVTQIDIESMLGSPLSLPIVPPIKG